MARSGLQGFPKRLAGGSLESNFMTVCVMQRFETASAGHAIKAKQHSRRKPFLTLTGTSPLGLVLVSSSGDKAMHRHQVVKYTTQGHFLGIVSGLGRNVGTWDSDHSKRTAQRHASALRNQDTTHIYKVESVS